jgi:CMP/dCMP kinase
MIITIDGPSGTGKSTVAKRLADHLGVMYFDTGAMYRALTYQILCDHIDISDTQRIERLLERFSFRIVSEQGHKRYYVGDQEVTTHIRTPEVTKHVSEVSALSMVRQHLVEIQRRFASQGDAVFEGRDMGTVVFPQAELKVFLTARSQVRAERRYKEFVGKNPALAERLTPVQVQAEIEARDQYDSTREISPLKQAEDAILIDTSDLTADEVVQLIITLLKERT